MKLVWIHGKRSVEEALQANRHIEKIYIANGVSRKRIESLLQQASRKKIPCIWVPRGKLDQMIKQENHQGILAQVEAYEYASLEDCLKRAKRRKEHPFLLLLDGVEDPHNFGSILRTAEATGVHGVIIPKKRAVGLTSTVAKTSAGAIEYVPVARVTNLKRTAEWLKEIGFWIIGSDGSAEQVYHEVDYNCPLALVIGNEGKGISRLMKEKCDLLVRLPMMGHMASLNASVAAGILMYEVVRSRKAHA